MNETKASRKISYLLRHDEDFIDENGWAATQSVIAEMKKKYPEFNLEVLQRIVENDEKGRYCFDESGEWIRANQGHSAHVDVELEKKEPPEILYHGTAQRFLDCIMKEGLNGQTRLYVHLSWNEETAVNVGKRHGKPIVLKINAQKMQEDGYEFFESVNHVWLTKKVPVQYIEMM